MSSSGGALGLQLSMSHHDATGEFKCDSRSKREVPDWSSIALQDIMIEEPLGKGQFSTVHKGTYKGVPVALKMIEHCGRLSDKVLREVKLSKNVCHRNVVAVLLDETHKHSNPVSGLFTSMNLGQGDVFVSGESVSVNSEFFTDVDTGFTQHAEHREADNKDAGEYVTWIVMEYCDRGSLSQALHRHALCYGGREHQPNMAHIVLTAMDIASAMQYLHFKGIIHGDLKAQNCLLMSDPADARGFVCKVGDFGFSQKINMDSHIETFTCGTVSHQPPELLRDGILTPAADVYAFGMLLWQLVMCKTPYSNLSHQQIVVNVVEGRRPAVPQNCPLAYTNLMQECWRQDRIERPCFQHILEKLTEMLSEWSQPQDFCFRGAAGPAGSGSGPDLTETFRPQGDCEFSWLSTDFDHRATPSPDVPLWSSEPTNIMPVGEQAPNLRRATCCYMLPGYGNNPLFNSEIDFRMGNGVNESSADGEGMTRSLPLVARSSMGRAAQSRDRRRTGYGKITFMTPQT